MKNLRKFIISLMMVIIIFISVIFIFKMNVVFKLKGDNKLYLNLNETYIEYGYIASIFNYDISKKVKIFNNLNTSIVGNYNINYSLKFLWHKYLLRREINVVDNTPPSIELNGDDEIKIYVGDTFIDEGAVAIDNYDKDITDNIIIESNLDTTKEGEYSIVYSAKDSSGNENKVTRKVIVQNKNMVSNYGFEDINNSIVKYVKEHNYDVSIGYYNLITNKKFLYRENKIYYGASLIKTLDAIYLYDNNLINDSTKSYVKKAISVSDNNAHQYLVNYIGRDNLKNYGINLGAKNTLAGDDNFGNTTVNDQIVYLKKLYNITKNNEELKSYFINDYGNYLKINNLSVMHKYGYYGQYYHDVGIVLDNEPYIIVILTNHGNDNKQEIINNLANLMYKYHKGEL